MKKLNSFTLKIIAMITMLLDHVYAYIGGTGIDVPIWFGYLGKIAAPIFFYLIVEGFFHTKSKVKYLSRLASFGIVMIGIDKIMGISNNIFLSLTLSVLMLMVIDYAKKSKKSYIYIIATLAVVAIGAAYMFTEASMFGLGMTLIFYFFRDKKIIMAIVYSLFSLMPVFASIGTPNSYAQLFLYDYQWMMLFALPLILMYNGKLGLKNTITKWMFYIFYPAHLITLVLIGRLL
ncbi:conjugal transfer protein TraX [Clostridium gasigenes]|uniref:TraX family protein n=1 Tax=Clostridium gasigenes TaxID=94869 RepID=UPI00143832C6|nr:TraX family protein [Clostridium gasigenes]NKF06091.1 conjugal transfer protein TraX [Clostridium gasigenes]QSW19187.1 conjugal transfer protein TraX [Clostridium gasigenes]